jgi:hypothetical protein
MDAALKADIAKIYATWMALTHEDLEEMYAAEGRGCKSCEAPTSASWWRGGGDIYCLACKGAMRGLAKFTRVTHRAANAKAA